MLEDDVIAVFANHLRKLGYLILAEGGNQVSAFRHELIIGKTKSPDLVVFKSGILSVFEVKIRPADLFKSAGNDYSDYDSIIAMLHNGEICDLLICEAFHRLKACGHEYYNDIKISAGLIANGSITTIKPNISLDNLTIVNVDIASSSVCFEFKSDLWPAT